MFRLIVGFRPKYIIVERTLTSWANLSLLGRSSFLEELIHENRGAPLDAEAVVSTAPRRLLRRGCRPSIDGAISPLEDIEQTDPVLHGHTVHWLATVSFLGDMHNTRCKV